MVTTKWIHQVYPEAAGEQWEATMSSRRTMQTWPRRIGGLEDVPEDFAGCGAFDGATYEQAVFVPEDMVLINGRPTKTLPQVVLLQGDRLTVLEKTRKGIVSVAHVLSDIYLLRVRKVLLSAEFSVASHRGFSRIAYNAARHSLFDPFQAAIRHAWSGRQEAPRSMVSAENQAEKLAALPGIHHKFVSYGAAALLPGATIMKMFFRDSINIKKTRRGLFRWIDHFTSPLLVLRTEDELIMVEEPGRMRNRKRREFGGIFTYLPLSLIKSMALEEGDLSRLRIELPDGEKLVQFFCNPAQVRALL
jgi:hypothetical protein